MGVNIKLNSSYKEAHDSKERYRIIYGGSGSGKSHFIAQETLLNMLSDSNYKYLVVRKTGKTIRNSVYRLLENLISEYNLGSYFKTNKTEMTIKCATGAELLTSGLDDVEKLKSIADINRIWVEEASEISETDFNQLDLRLRGTSKIGYQITMTFNPISELHWIKRAFFDIGKENSYILKTTYKNNTHLDADYIKTLERLEEVDLQYYRIYALGEWGSLGNLVYTNWEKRDLTEEEQMFDSIHHGVDFGFAEDPTAYVKVHLDKKHKTIYIFDEMFETELHIDELAQRIKGKVGSDRLICDSSEPRSIDDLKRQGIKARGAKKGAGSIEHGIKWIQGHKIVVSDKCTNIIKELSSYKWKEDKDGNIIAKPVDMNNHGLDALRYALEEEMVIKEKWGW